MYLINQFNNFIILIYHLISSNGGEGGTQYVKAYV